MLELFKDASRTWGNGIDCDWEEAFAYGHSPTRANPTDTAVSLASVLLAGVVDVIGHGVERGDYAETTIRIVGKLVDGRYFALEAGCDTTGWDCQAGGSAAVASTLDDILAFGIDDATAATLGPHRAAHRCASPRRAQMTRTTKSYASVPPFGTPIEELANSPALDEQREECPFSDGPGDECHGCREQRREEEMRAEGTAELHDEYGVVFGVAHWRPGTRGEAWFARATSNARVMTVGRTVAAVTRQLARKLETR